MAQPRLIETDDAGVPAPGRILTDKDGNITNDSVIAVNSFLESIASKVSKLSLGSGTNYSRAGNFDAQYIEFTMPSVADTEKAVDHSLKRVPQGYLVVAQNKAGSVYTSNYQSWTKNIIYFKSNTASMLVKILLF